MPSEDTPLLVDEDADQDEEAGFLARKGHFSHVEKLAMGTAFGFFLLAALAFGLYAGAESKLSHRRPAAPAGTVTTTQTVTSTLPAPTRPPTPGDTVCLSSTCVRMAADVLEGLDESVDPCDDFYTFANGGWLSQHPIPEDKGLFGIAQWIGDYNQRVLHSILDASIDRSLPEDDQINLKHLRALYDSCLDEDSLDRRGLDPLIEVADAALALWQHAKSSETTQALPPWMPPIFPLPDPEDEATKAKLRRLRMTNVLLFLHSRGVPAFFSTYLEGDTKNDPNLQRVWLVQARLGLPDKEYYEDNETLDVYREAVRASLASLCDQLSNAEAICKKGSAGMLARAIVDLETDIARVSMDSVDLEDPTLTYNPRNSSELQHLFPNIDWRDYFSGYSPRPSFPEPAVVATIDYFSKVSAIVNETSDQVIGAYLLWRIAGQYGRLLGPRETVRKEVAWLDNFISGVEEGVREGRGDVCLRSVIGSAGFLIGRYYVQRAFSPKAKSYAEMIIAATIQAFKSRLPELDWLDADTRRLAEEKASAITQKIAYPLSPNTTDPAALRRYFAVQEPFDRDDYFGNVLRANMAREKRMWNRVGAQRDRGEWEMTPDEVNAYYNPAANEIAFPAGILQSPYFNADWPEYMAFGAFGSVAGHELSHAFDSTGAQYDKDGKLFDWWNKETEAQFKERQKCILDQYAEYYVLDRKGRKVHVNSRFTLGEDIADAGGIAQSHRAWRDRFDSDGRDANFKLPGLKYTRDQLFWIAYARGWARNIRTQEAVRRIRTDPHSPTKFRVLGPLGNSREFAEAFGCNADSRMIRENRCQLRPRVPAPTCILIGLVYDYER